MKVQFNYILLSCFGFICSCSNHTDPTKKTNEKIALQPPIQVVAKKPKITLLDTCPPPQVISVPQKMGGSYTKRSEGKTQTINLLPPAVTKAGFYVPMKQYDVEEGLALSTVTCSYCDNAGNLWFGTYPGGVSEFDGKKFTNFRTSHGLVDNQLFSIFQDKSGTMWFGTYNGVTSYDGKNMKQFRDSTACCQLLSLAQDREGNMWFGTYGNGASKLKGTFFENHSPADGLAGYIVNCMLTDKNGYMWFGTENGLSRYDGKSFKTFRTEQGLSDNKITSLLEDMNGNIWLGSSKGVTMFDGKNFKSFTLSDGLINNNVTCLLQAKNNHIWIGTENGVSEFDGTGFKNYTTANGLINNRIASIVQDKEQNIWFTTHEDGIFRFSGIAFTSYSKEQGLPTNFTNSIFQQSNGRYWFGTYGKGAVHYDDTLFTTYSVNQGLADSIVYCTYEDKNRNLWFATQSGVSCFNGQTFTSYTTAQGLGVDLVWSITEDHKGNLWFATFGGGISMLTSDRKAIHTYTSEQGLYDDNIHEITADRKGNIWLNNDNGGITKFDGKTFTTYTDKQGLKAAWSLATLEDDHGNIWFGTSEGLFRYDGDFFLNYRNGLPEKDLVDIKKDAKGNLWVGSRVGISRLELKESTSKELTETRSINIDTNLSNKELAEKYKADFDNYNFKNGYPVKDVVYTNSIFVDAENSIWAATGKKLIRFEYDKLNRNLNPTTPFLTQVKLNNENIPWSDLIAEEIQPDSGLSSSGTIEETLLFGEALTPDQQNTMQHKFNAVRFDSITPYYFIPQNLVLPFRYNDITFEFSAIETTRPDFLNFQFMLEGYSINWSIPNNSRTASFGNISEGTYTFKLRAQNSDGVWGMPISYTFKVLPPWYRSWWAYGLYIIAFFLFVRSLIRRRTAILKKEKILLEEKVAQRTTDLQKEKQKVETTLSELKAAQAQLVQSEKMASLGELTAGIAHEIQNPLNFVNNFSEVNKELIGELKNEKSKGMSERDHELENQLLGDIEQNLEKINHHGKRADAIVKGMLQHSRMGSGQKEPTDINVLVSEYIRLAHHGLKAKDKASEVKLETHFDDGVGKINVIPQDIGKVLVNLINNAFYAASLPSKGGFSEADSNKTPTVWVSTKKENNKILISVRDNGPGIPANILDKIFQPFFTSKPTGQGTGLGLSLAYDIVKAHGGELTVKTKEGKGAEFIVQLLAYS